MKKQIIVLALVLIFCLQIVSAGIFVDYPQHRVSKYVSHSSDSGMHGNYKRTLAEGSQHSQRSSKSMYSSDTGLHGSYPRSLQEGPRFKAKKDTHMPHQMYTQECTFVKTYNNARLAYKYYQDSQYRTSEGYTRTCMHVPQKIELPSNSGGFVPHEREFMVRNLGLKNYW